MQFASEPEQSALANPEQVNERLRQFWRLRRHAEPSEITFADQYIDEPEITPRRFHQDLRRHATAPTTTSTGASWSGAIGGAAGTGRLRSTFGGWLAYRRMYPAAALFVIWLGLLVALAVNGVLLWPLVVAQLAALLALGAYGNVLYMMRFRRAALKAAQGDGQHQDRLDALARSGGTSRLAVCLMGIAGLAAATAAVVVTYWVRGSIVLNY